MAQPDGGAGRKLPPVGRSRYARLPPGLRGSVEDLADLMLSGSRDELLTCWLGVHRLVDEAAVRRGDSIEDRAALSRVYLQAVLELIEISEITSVDQALLFAMADAPEWTAAALESLAGQQAAAERRLADLPVLQDAVRLRAEAGMALPAWLRAVGPGGG